MDSSFLFWYQADGAGLHCANAVLQGDILMPLLYAIFHGKSRRSKLFSALNRCKSAKSGFFVRFDRISAPEAIFS